MGSTSILNRPPGRITSFVLAFLLAAMVLAPAAGLQRVAAQGSSVEDKTATVAPADALVYASINLDTKSDQFTLATELLTRAGLNQEVDTATSSASTEDQAVVDAVTGGYAAVVVTSLPAEFTGSLDQITSEASSVASDPTSLASGAVPSGFAVILQASDPDKAEASMRADLDKNATTETYEGVEITTIPAKSSDDTATSFARVGDFLVIATLADDIHPIIDTESGKTDSLASSDAFTTLTGELNAEWLTFGLVNGPAILDGLKSADPTVLAEIPASSLAQLNATTGFVFWADQPGFRMDTVSLSAADAPAAPATPAVSGDFASKVPADTLVFTNGVNINQYGILDAIGLVFAQALVGTESTTSPSATPVSMAEQEAAIYAKAAATLGFNLKTDFIDQLDGEYGFAISASDLTSSSPKIDAIFVNDTKNAQTVTDVASKIAFILSAAVDGDKISTREVGGGSITSIDAGDSSMPLTIEYGVVDGQLLVGVNGGIDTYVNGPAQPLSETELYQNTLAQLPGDATGISFVNLEQITPIIAEAESAYASSTAGSMPDASDACGKFDTQEEAQAAYDEDSFANFDLDMNGNGTACEDFFSVASPEASPAAAPMSGLKAVGSVTYVKNGNQATSTIILIGE